VSLLKSSWLRSGRVSIYKDEAAAQDSLPGEARPDAPQNEAHGAEKSFAEAEASEKAQASEGDRFCLLNLGLPGSGAVFVDRFLHTAMFYPGNYGFSNKFAKQTQYIRAIQTCKPFFLTILT
jgi:hypothetical protein